MQILKHNTVLLFLLVLVFSPVIAWAEPMTKKECQKCHSGPSSDVATAGGKHKGVPCVGCHFGHPPEVKKPIAECSKCHPKARRSHFELNNCLGCHKNPHKPLHITLPGKDACLTCHGQQVEQLKNNISKHSAFDCTKCHTVHRMIPQCTQCHKPHSTTMIDNCNKCHNAHIPKVVNFASNMPSEDCAGCHTKAAGLLSASQAKHKSLSCVFCHRGKHKTVPTCKECHGKPHPDEMLVKFPTCGTCHDIAHNLNK